MNFSSENSNTLNNARPCYAQGLSGYGSSGPSKKITAPNISWTPNPSHFFEQVRPFKNPLMHPRCVKNNLSTRYNTLTALECSDCYPPTN
jgi:hypothetical protein